ncbi:uncharacterized protein LOC144127773 [Amblyomma americanum]
MKRQKETWKGRAQELQESELEKEKEYWKSRAQELQDDNVFLKAQVASLQRCLESKIFQHKNAFCSHVICFNMTADVLFVNLFIFFFCTVEQQGKAHYSRGMTTGLFPVGTSCDALETMHGQCYGALYLLELALHARAPPVAAADEDLVGLACLSAATEAEERTSSPGEEQQQQHFLTPPAPTGEFSYMEDGSFYLTKGIVISGTCAEKIFKNKKPTLVIKDTAQAIWGNDVLVTRSVTGTACSKKRALGELPKQPLTPEKLLVVSETLKHWGVQKSVSTEEAEKTLTRTLTKKIQDLLKSKLRKQIKF